MSGLYAFVNVVEIRVSDARVHRRSESKTGLDNHVRKGGAGPHNWGSVRDELEHERQGLEDAELDREELADVPVGVDASKRAAYSSSEEKDTNLSEEELLKAREIRAKGLNGDGELCCGFCGN